MERLEGETIGRRIVRMPVPDRLPLQMAEELAKIHALPPERLPFLEEASVERLIEELDEFGEPHPAIELGLWWLREHRPPPRAPVVVHGDFRIGNLVTELRLGGIADVDPYLERYNELTGFEVRPEELDYWELAGNVGWAIGCLTQAQRHLTGQDRSVELAILGRLGGEVEYEICHLLERQGVA
jgi:aminoglycoside phosphotransferase (APT) family kinase protein